MSGAGRPRLALATLVAAHTMAAVGNTITVFATPFLIRSLGGSAAQVGLATAVATVPVVLGGPLSGVLIDRVGARRFSIASDLVSGATVLAIAAGGALPLAGLLALLALSGLFDTPGQTARTVLLPALARAARLPLERAAGLSSGAERTAALIGAPVAGALVASIGVERTFLVDAAFFALSAGLAARIPAALARPSPLPADPAAGAGGVAHYWQDFLEGLRTLVRRPLLRDIAVIVLIFNALDAARFSVLLPLYSLDRLGGASAAGLITGALAGGSVAGAALFSAWSHRLPRRTVFIVCFALTGGPLSAAFLLQAPLGALVALSAATGLFGGMLNPLINTLRLELTPPHLLARVQSLMIAVAWAGIPVGSLLAGVAADRVAVPTVFGIVGGLYVLTALVPLAGPSWRVMEGPSAPRGTPSSG